MTEVPDEPSDGEIVDPDGSVEIDGETVTVRAFRFGEQLQAGRIARPIIDALAERLVEQSGGEEGEPTGMSIHTAAVLEIMDEHADAWVSLLALSTGLDEDRIRNLEGQQGMSLSMEFWSVNAPFFSNRLALRQAMAAPSPSSESSPS